MWSCGKNRYSARSWASAEYWIHFRARTVCTILPISVSQISRNLNTKRRSVSPWILLGTEFWKFCRKGSFFQKKTLNNRNFFNVLRLQAAITPQWRKFITKRSLYGMSSFHFYHWNQFKVIPLVCTLRTRNLSPNFLRRRTWVDGIRHIALTQAVTIDRLLSHVSCPSLMTEDTDVEVCKSFNLKKRALRVAYCGRSTQYSHLV